MLSNLMDRVGLSGALLRPSHFLAFCLASCSIVTLLAYFTGQIGMPAAVRWLLLPSIGLLILLAVWASRTGRRELLLRIGAGLWAGSCATLFYDVVRVPLVHSGVPVFKAISYFGTIILSLPRPTLASELAGWSYHFSNGIGFAIMYTLLVRRPGWLSAVIWGVTLEAVMLVTPYAEIFGYRKSPMFMVVTIGSHVFYGLGLWAAAAFFWKRVSAAPGGRRFGWKGAGLLAAAWMVGPLSLAAIGADFHRLHAATIPVSPPSRIGPDLYVTWNVPEPDRIGAIWLMTRFVEPGAEFHLISPMSKADFGRPFDLPEAEIRRYVDQSTFQVLLEKEGLGGDPALQVLSQLCYLTEIRPWALSSNPEAMRLANDLAARIEGCQDLNDCLKPGLAWFDETYATLSGGGGSSPP